MSPKTEVIVAKGYGLRIREMIADRASQIVRTAQSMRRYTDTQFAAEVGLAERGKEYPASTLGEWLAERNEPRIATALAMEMALERPGAAVYLIFGVWPAAGADGKIPWTPGADPRPVTKAPLPRPSATKSAAAGRAGRRPRR